MIASLSGILLTKHPAHVIIDVGGVGYEVLISSRTYDHLPGKGDEVFLHMECRSDTKIEGVPLRARIDVGNRLLIYVYKWDLSGSLQEILRKF